MHYIISLLIKPLLKVVYLWSEVEKKVTLFRIISILGLLTHIYICPFSMPVFLRPLIGPQIT